MLLSNISKLFTKLPGYLLKVLDNFNCEMEQDIFILTRTEKAGYPSKALTACTAQY